MSNKNPSHTRRSFLKKSAIASSIFIIPRHVLGGTGYTPPSDQLNLAAIGSGGKGRSDILNATVNGRERVVALCDIDPFAKHGVLASREKFPNANFYTDFREMLDREKDIDAVTISTPDHTHGVLAMAAMERDIHVYVQKPLTHNIKEARLLTETARHRKIVTQMGNQGASNPAQLQVQAWIKEKKIGKIHTVKVWTNRPVWPQGIAFPEPTSAAIPKDLAWDLWVGPAQSIPYNTALHPFNWRGWWDYGTGALGDMGCHLIDVPFKALGLKYPTAVECSVGSVYKKMWTAEYLPKSCPPSSFVSLNFDKTKLNPSPITLEWYDGGIRPAHPDIVPASDPLGDKSSSNGVIMIGDKGVITTGVYGYYPRLYRKGKEVVTYEQPKDKEPEHGHQRKWIDAVKAGFNSPEHKALTSSFDYAGPMTETVLMGNIAIRSYFLRKKNKQSFDYYGRKKLLWDGEKMKITNLAEANQFVGRTYRPGWELT